MHFGLIMLDINDAIKEGNGERLMRLYNYNHAKLHFGLIMLDINDAIKEGNGERLMRLYKVALLIFKCCGCIEYA